MSSRILEYRRDLLDKIPVSRAMGIEIESLDDRHVRVSAPLKENINYQGTAFGGSLNAVAILTCYLMLHHLLRSRQIDFKRVVIQSGNVQFLKPVTGDFIAECALPGEAELFIQSLKTQGRARLDLNCEIRLVANEAPRVKFHGAFVAKI